MKVGSKARWVVEENTGFKWKQLGRRKFYRPQEAIERLGPEWLRVLEITGMRIRNTRTGQVIYVAEVSRAA